MANRSQPNDDRADDRFARLQARPSDGDSSRVELRLPGGVRASLQPSPVDEAEPATWIEAVRLVYGRLRSIPVSIVCLIDDTLKGLSGLMRGLGGRRTAAGSVKANQADDTPLARNSRRERQNEVGGRQQTWEALSDSVKAELSGGDMPRDWDRNLREKNILVVDDDPDVLHVICTVFREGGANVTACGDGKRALELTRRLRLDLVVLDLMLPGRGGFQVLEELQAEKAR